MKPASSSALLECVVLAWAVLACVEYTGALQCYQCQNVHNVSECHYTNVCHGNQHCYTSSTGTGRNAVVNLGCKPQQDCLPGHHIPVVSPVGRAVATTPTSGCNQCCGTDNCNTLLCTAGTSTVLPSNANCTDDPTFHCSLIAGTFNICGDIQHAKIRCRKFCGLCNLADGAWATWSGWSVCDVTCGVGTETRSRSCTNPVPSHGGLNCVGNTMETKRCVQGHCPVNGGWSRWSGWGSCSVTCGVGMQRRGRDCSNPRPGPMGNSCSGDPLNYKICLPGACHDGGWSAWNQWTNCSSLCDGGLQTRNRTCTNPAPSMLGKMCQGSSEQTAACNNKNCSSGVQFAGGQSAFFVYGPELKHFEKDVSVMTFKNIKYNVGNDYDLSFAINEANITISAFICDYPGLYTFKMAHIIEYIKDDDMFVYINTTGTTKCGFYNNDTAIQVDERISMAVRFPPSFHYSASATVHINKGDVVFAVCHLPLPPIRNDGWFSGVLISPDANTY